MACLQIFNRLFVSVNDMVMFCNGIVRFIVCEVIVQLRYRCKSSCVFIGSFVGQRLGAQSQPHEEGVVAENA